MNKDDKNVQNNADTKKIITCRMCGQLSVPLRPGLLGTMYPKDPVLMKQKRKDVKYEKIRWITFFTGKFSKANS